MAAGQCPPHARVMCPAALPRGRRAGVAAHTHSHTAWRLDGGEFLETGRVAVGAIHRGLERKEPAFQYRALARRSMV